MSTKPQSPSLELAAQDDLQEPLDSNAGTPNVTIMIPTADLVVEDPLAIMKEYLHSYSVSQTGIPNLEVSTSTKSDVLADSLYDNLEEMLKPHN